MTPLRQRKCAAPGAMLRAAPVPIARRVAGVSGRVLLIALLFAGCARESAVRNSGESDALVVRQAVGELAVEMRVQPPEPRVGDIIRVTLRADAASGAVVEFPDNVPGLARPPIETAPNARVYEFSAIESGDVMLPTLTLRVRPQFSEFNSPPAELSFEGPRLRVRSMLSASDTPDRPRDIIGASAAPPRPLTVAEWSVIGGWGLVGVCGVWLVAAWVRRARRRPPTPLPPDVAALRALAALAPGGQLDQGRLREVHERFAEILCEFLRRRFSIGAPDMTTDELLQRAQSLSGENGIDVGVVRLILTACDGVKYAAGAPDLRATEQLLSVLRAFVASAGGEASSAGGSSGGAA
ncbi:MAG: hypothetical protein IPM64_14870 [Phycisphaerales bacterium]|nr:hypothetical protein [Phycisphaerales bacterium]